MTSDDHTQAVARQVAQAVTVAVRLLRIPTLIVLVLPLPFIALVLTLGVQGDGIGGAIALGLGTAMAVLSLAFGWRRSRVLRAVDEIEPLTSQIAIALTLTDHVDEARTALNQAAGAGGGLRFFTRLQGAWRASRTPARWIQSVGDLPRARYFFPPKLATSLQLSLAATALIPISVVVAIFIAIGALAGTI